MSNEIALKFGSFVLDDSSMFCINKISISEDKAVNIHKIPRTRGSIAEEAERQSLSITVSGSIVNSDYDALRTSFDLLKAALQDGLQKFTTDDDRYIMAQVESLSYEYVKLRTMITWEASFVAHYPYWLAETASVDDRQPTSGAGYAITNNGNAPARIKIEITAPAGGITDDIKIENQTTGKSFQYRGTINEAEVLEVDNRVDGDDFEVLNDGADAKVDYEGDLMELDPGENTIIFTGPAGTAVKITHRDTWQ